MSNERIDQRIEILQGYGGRLKFQCRVDGEAVEPDDSPSIHVHEPNGNLLLTINSNEYSASGDGWYETGVILDDQPLGDHWSFVVLFTYQNEEYQDRTYFDIVRLILRCPVHTDDLIDVYPNLTQHLQALEIPDCVQFIRRAWSKLLDRIRSTGVRPSRITEKERLINPTIELALAFTCQALAREAEDIWDMRSRKHFKDYDTSVAGLGELDHDSNDDGIVDVGEAANVSKRKFTV